MTTCPHCGRPAPQTDPNVQAHEGQWYHRQCLIILGALLAGRAAA